MCIAEVNVIEQVLCQNRLYDDWQRRRKTEYDWATTGTREPTWQRRRKTTPPEPGSPDYIYALNKTEADEASDMTKCR